MACFTPAFGLLFFGLEDENSAKDYAEIKPYTPAWGEQITGV
ncbi:respiratory nitrate reductase 2 alpha chain domain protein, partial [Escherichia coli 97.0007]